MYSSCSVRRLRGRLNPARDGQDCEGLVCMDVRRSHGGTCCTRSGSGAAKRKTVVQKTELHVIVTRAPVHSAAGLPHNAALSRRWAVSQRGVVAPVPAVARAPATLGLRRHGPLAVPVCPQQIDSGPKQARLPMRAVDCAVVPAAIPVPQLLAELCAPVFTHLLAYENEI